MLQIKHQNLSTGKCLPRGQCTFAIELFPKAILQTLLDHGTEKLPVELGIAYLHPSDQYNKKVGRELAMSKATILDAYFSQVTIKENQRVIFHFHVYFPEYSRVSNKGKYLGDTVKFGISYVPDHFQTRLEYIEM